MFITKRELEERINSAYWSGYDDYDDFVEMDCTCTECCEEETLEDIIDDLQGDIRTLKGDMVMLTHRLDAQILINKIIVEKFHELEGRMDDSIKGSKSKASSKPNKSAPTRRKTDKE